MLFIIVHHSSSWFLAVVFVLRSNKDGDRKYSLLIMLPDILDKCEFYLFIYFCMHSRVVSGDNS